MAYKIIDAHAHIYPAAIAHKAVVAIGDFYDIPMHGPGTPEGLLERGSTIGVERYLVHSVATTPAQVVSINNFIYAQTQQHPEFIGFATLHPLMENLEEEVDRIISLGLRGVKLHPDFQKFQLDSPEALRLFRCIAGRLPVLLHTGDARYDFSGPQRMAAALDAVPDLTAIAAHFGGYSQWQDVRAHLIGRDVYMDTSSSLTCLEPAEAVAMIRDHGVEKFLFGTDYPMWDHDAELSRFLALPLTEEERQAILYGNAARLLKL